MHKTDVYNINSMYINSMSIQCTFILIAPFVLMPDTFSGCVKFSAILLSLLAFCFAYFE